VHHRPDAHLTAYLDAHPFDLVGLSFVAGYYQYRKAMALVMDKLVRLEGEGPA